tara:strand:+ start:246 stop:776 length:531 start_codon:yes stop_codon:yes gene_type:complete
MLLSRTPEPFVCRTKHKGLKVKSDILSDGTLVLILSVGRHCSECPTESWYTQVEECIQAMFAHVRKHRVGFGILLHVRPEASLSLEVIQRVKNMMTGNADIIRDHLKGTMIIVPTTPVKLMILAVLAISPPLKTVSTFVLTSEGMNNPLKWGLPKDLQMDMCSEIVGLPWPDATNV